MNGECRYQTNSSRLTPQTSDTGANPPDVPPRTWWVDPRCPRFGVSSPPLSLFGSYFFGSSFSLCTMYLSLSHSLCGTMGGRGVAQRSTTIPSGHRRVSSRQLWLLRMFLWFFGGSLFLPLPDGKDQDLMLKPRAPPFPQPLQPAPLRGASSPCPALPCSASSTATTVN